MTPQEFHDLTATLAALNEVDEDTAADWLILIGDTPEFTEDGRVILPESHGRTIAWPAEDF